MTISEKNGAVWDKGGLFIEKSPLSLLGHKEAGFA